MERPGQREEKRPSNRVGEARPSGGVMKMDKLAKYSLFSRQEDDNKENRKDISNLCIDGKGGNIRYRGGGVPSPPKSKNTASKGSVQTLVPKDVPPLSSAPRSRPHLLSFVQSKSSYKNNQPRSREKPSSQTKTLDSVQAGIDTNQERTDNKSFSGNNRDRPTPEREENGMAAHRKSYSMSTVKMPRVPEVNIYADTHASKLADNVSSDHLSNNPDPRVNKFDPSDQDRAHSSNTNKTGLSPTPKAYLVDSLRKVYIGDSGLKRNRSQLRVDDIQDMFPSENRLIESARKGMLSKQGDFSFSDEKPHRNPGTTTGLANPPQQPSLPTPSTLPRRLDFTDNPTPNSRSFVINHDGSEKKQNVAVHADKIIAQKRPLNSVDFVSIKNNLRMKRKGGEGVVESTGGNNNHVDNDLYIFNKTLDGRQGELSAGGWTRENLQKKLSRGGTFTINEDSQGVSLQLVGMMNDGLRLGKVDLDVIKQYWKNLDHSPLSLLNMDLHSANSLSLSRAIKIERWSVAALLHSQASPEHPGVPILSDLFPRILKILRMAGRISVCLSSTVEEGEERTFTSEELFDMLDMHTDKAIGLLAKVIDSFGEIYKKEFKAFLANIDGYSLAKSTHLAQQCFSIEFSKIGVFMGVKEKQSQARVLTVESMRLLGLVPGSSPENERLNKTSGQGGFREPSEGKYSPSLAKLKVKSPRNEPTQGVNRPVTGLASRGSPFKSPADEEIDQDELDDLRKLVLDSAEKKSSAPTPGPVQDSPDPPKANNRKFDLNPEFLFQPIDADLLTFPVILPPKTCSQEYTLVVDLDETLVHYDNDKKLFYVRPYTRHFLRELSKHYEIVVFTAAMKDYTDYILQKVDIEQTISHKLYREHTTLVDGIFIKDLSKLGRDLSKTVIIDNNPKSFQLHPSNGVYIRTWKNDPADKALLRLSTILSDIASRKFPDVRLALKKLKDKMMTIFATEGRLPEEVKLSSEYSSIQ